jgi:PPOX class probable F420-dependent enzyme
VLYTVVVAPTITPAVRSVLNSRLDATLATIRPDGMPELAPVWFLWQRGTLIVSTHIETRRWANLVRDPRCSVLIDDMANDRYVAIYGRAELVRGDVRAPTRAIVARYIEADRVDEYMRDVVYTRPERTLIKLKPDRLVAVGFG